MAYKYSEELRARYLKVHALAERGIEGERVAAAKRRGALEAEYPDLGIEALRWQTEQEEAAKAKTAPPKPPPPPPAEAPSIFPKLGGSWDSLFNSAVRTAANLAETAINTEAGRRAADMIFVFHEADTKEQRKSGVWRMDLHGALGQLQWARVTLTEPQKQAFAKAVGDRVAARVYQLLI